MAEKRSGRRRAAASAGKKTALLAAVLVVLAALGAWLWARSDPFPRLEAAGYRIGEAEYLRAMYRARNDVLSDHAAAGISLTDWDAETALGDPRRMVMDRALEILAEYYAVSTLAVERGYLADAGYAAMEADMAEINRQRREAMEAGAVITGFSNFTTEDYLSYRASNIRLQFCGDPENPEYPVTDGEIRQRYEADRDNLYRQPDAMELAFLLIDAAPGEADGLEGELQDLEALARQRGSLAAALEEMPRLREFYQEIAVDPGNYGTWSRSHGDVLDWAEDLAEGEISPVFRREDRLCLVECRTRTDHDYVPLEEVESVVVQSIRESRYDALIAERTENTEILGDLQALYRFTAAQLP